jgi:hypothetical protein
MAGNNISTANISLGMDATQAEAGFNRIGQLIEGMGSRLQSATARGAAFGTFLGNLSWKALELGTQKVQDLARSILNTRLEIEKTDFSKMIGEGADPKELMKTEKFDQSILGGTSKMAAAWAEIVDSTTTVFSPAISGVFTAVAAVMKSIGEWIGETFKVSGENLKSIFESCYKITLQIAEKLIEGGTEVAKLINSTRLLGNKSATGSAWDKILFDVGWIDRREMNKRMNDRLADPNNKGDIEHINTVNNANDAIENLKKSALKNIDGLIKNMPAFNLDPAKVFGVKVPEKQEKPVDLNAVFAPLMEAGGMADWKQTQLQRGAAQNLDQERFKKQMDKQDETKKAIDRAAEKIVAAVQNVKPSGVVGVVSIAQGGGK